MPDPQTSFARHGGHAGTVRVLSKAQRKLFISDDDVPEGHEVIGGPASIIDKSWADGHDLDGLFFSTRSNLGASDGHGNNLTWNHMVAAAVDVDEEFALGLADHVFKYPIRTLRTAHMLYFEAMLEEADEYERFVREMADAGALGSSTGAPAHMVEMFDKDDNTISFARSLAEGYGEFKLWPVAEVAVLTGPAEPRTRSIGTVRGRRAFLDMEKPAQRVSLDDVRGEIYEAFRERFDPDYDQPVWIEDVVVDDNATLPLSGGTVIAYYHGTNYSMPFTRESEGLVFANRDAWQEVERKVEWITRASPQRQAYFKATGKTLPLFGNEPPPDDTSGSTSGKPTRTIMHELLKKFITRFEAASDDAARASIRSAVLETVDGEDLAEAPEEIKKGVETIRAWTAPAPTVKPKTEPAPDILTAEYLAKQIDEATRKLRDELSKSASPGNFGFPGVALHADTARARRYDFMETPALAFMVDLLYNAHRKGHGQLAYPEAYYALAQRMTSEETAKSGPLYQSTRAYVNFSRTRSWTGLKDIDPREVMYYAMEGQRRWADDSQWAGRANELMGSTVTDGGDEWIGVAYANAVWDDIYHASLLLQKIGPSEWPWPGAESGTIPLVDADVSVYKVPGATDLSASPGGIPTGTLLESKLDTGNKSMTLFKMGARTLYEASLAEDSMLPFVPELFANIQRAGLEHIDSLLVDGDDETSGSTNINDIAGTPDAKDYFMSANGMRKLALITNSGNSTSVGTLTGDTFAAIRALLGTGGAHGLDPKRILYVSDTNVFYKAILLPVVRTQAEVGPLGTIITGDLKMVDGTEYYASPHMHLVGKNAAGASLVQNKKANTAGKIDQDTGGNNTTGSLLCIVPDLWRFYWRRRMTIGTQYWAYADTYDVVMHMRASFNSRDNEASAIGYNITV